LNSPGHLPAFILNKDPNCISTNADYSTHAFGYKMRGEM